MWRGFVLYATFYNDTPLIFDHCIDERSWVSTRWLTRGDRNLHRDMLSILTEYSCIQSIVPVDERSCVIQRLESTGSRTIRDDSWIRCSAEKDSNWIVCFECYVTTGNPISPCDKIACHLQGSSVSGVDTFEVRYDKIIRYAGKIICYGSSDEWCSEAGKREWGRGRDSQRSFGDRQTQCRRGCIEPGGWKNTKNQE